MWAGIGGARYFRTRAASFSVRVGKEGSASVHGSRPSRPTWMTGATSDGSSSVAIATSGEKPSGS
jgi:hypothetical protein